MGLTLRPWMTLSSLGLSIAVAAQIQLPHIPLLPDEILQQGDEGSGVDLEANATVRIQQLASADYQSLAPNSIRVTLPQGNSTIHVNANPKSKEFQTTLGEYWNSEAGINIPLCIVYPTSAQQASTIFKALHNSVGPDGEPERFAVKGGGHMPNTMMNNVDGGVLIALEKMATIDYDAASQTVKLGPGLR